VSEKGIVWVWVRCGVIWREVVEGREAVHEKGIGRG
jgi:hypothetical protein